MSKEITVSVRTETGRGPARRSRKGGVVPAVLYGKGVATKLLAATVGELEAAVLSVGDEVVLSFDGGKVNAVVGEIQFNYLKNHMVHIDFVARA